MASTAQVHLRSNATLKYPGGNTPPSCYSPHQHSARDPITHHTPNPTLQADVLTARRPARGNAPLSPMPSDPTQLNCLVSLWDPSFRVFLSTRSLCLSASSDATESLPLSSVAGRLVPHPHEQFSSLRLTEFTLSSHCPRAMSRDRSYRTLFGPAETLASHTTGPSRAPPRTPHTRPRELPSQSTHAWPTLQKFLMNLFVVNRSSTVFVTVSLTERLFYFPKVMNTSPIRPAILLFSDFQHFPDWAIVFFLHFGWFR